MKKNIYVVELKNKDFNANCAVKLDQIRKCDELALLIGISLKINKKTTIMLKAWESNIGIITETKNNKKSLLTIARSDRWYIDCFSKSSGPSKKIVPSVISCEMIFCRIAKSGEPQSSRYTGRAKSGFFREII